MLQRQLVWLNVLAPPLRVWPLHLRAFPNSSVLLPLRFAIHHFRIFHHFRNHVRIFPSLSPEISVIHISSFPDPWPAGMRLIQACFL